MSPDSFLSLEIPLPSVPGQRRIVAQFEELAAKIEEARGLRAQAMAESDRMLIALAHRADLDAAVKQEERWRHVAIGEVVRLVSDPCSVKVDGVYPNFGIYSFGRGLFKKPPILGSSTGAEVLYRVRAGQFIYSRLFAFEGAYGMVTEQFDGHFVSGEYPVFECDPGRVRAEFLYSYFKSPAIWEQVAAGSKGLGHRRQRVQPAQVLAHRLMLPAMEWQDRIASVLAGIGRLKAPQAETATGLEALVPSVLSRAFKDEL